MNRASIGAVMGGVAGLPMPVGLASIAQGGPG
jgi:hypothetical protein